MASLDLLQSGIGAFIGFLLGQSVNVAAFCWERYKRPRLVIEEPENGYRILSHSTQVDDSHELVKERMYGFIVRNVGRRIATGVRFQLLKAEYREEGGEFNTVARHAFGLSIYTNTYDETHGPVEATLIPKAAVLVHLGSWREDYDVDIASRPHTPRLLHGDMHERH
jgi:hypothetical protein